MPQSAVALPSFDELLIAEAKRRRDHLRELEFYADGSPRPVEKKFRLEQAERVKCGADIFYWLDTYAWLEDPKRDDPRLRVFPLILWEGQRELVSFLLDGLEKAEDRNVNKARELGVSWISCLVLVHEWLFEKGFKAKVGSRKEDYVDDGTSDSLFGKMRFALTMQPLFLLPKPFRDPKTRRRYDLYMKLLNPETRGEIIGESTNEGFGRGGRRAVVLIDEDAHVQPRLQVKVHDSLETVARSVWSVSTPNSRGNRFHSVYAIAKKQHEAGDDRGWSKWLELDWRTDPRKTEAWFEGLLRENGGSLTWDAREQEHNCSFAGVSGLRILKADRRLIAYTDADLPRGARERFFYLAPMDFGSGPSWTVIYFILCSWEEDDDPRPTLFVDYEIVWQRVSVDQIAEDIIEASKRYTGAYWYTGDPAGKAVDSKQESWQSNLNHYGVPLSLLPDEYNDHHLTNQNLEESQVMLDARRVRIHEENCPLAFETVESWEWDLPDGIPLELVNRKTISPKKNAFSHTGDALFRYGVGAALRIERPTIDKLEKIQPEDPTEGSAIEGVFEQILGPSRGGW